MKEWLSAYRSEALSALLSLILLLAGWAIPGIVSPSGTVTLSKEQVFKAAGVTIALTSGLLSYTIQLWRRDRKRERVKFAADIGRPICGCTETGEIALDCKGGAKCPKCGEMIYDSRGCM
jgi:hypothetical protein